MSDSFSSRGSPQPDATGSGNNRVDKLRDGPCSEIYEKLNACTNKSKARFGKKQLEECPSETDMLIKCIGKHPLYFHSKPPPSQQK